jgi:hypothetical protein
MEVFAEQLHMAEFSFLIQSGGSSLDQAQSSRALIVIVFMNEKHSGHQQVHVIAGVFIRQRLNEMV